MAQPLFWLDGIKRGNNDIPDFATVGSIRLHERRSLSGGKVFLGETILMLQAVGAVIIVGAVALGRTDDAQATLLPS